MVDSTPTGVAPPSTMRSMRPPRSASTWSAVVGDTWPERLADGATTGLPKAARISRATVWSGTRTAMVSRPAVASSATGQLAALGRTSVSGPGQNAAASRVASASKRASACAACRSATWAMSGLKAGRPLACVEPRDGPPVGRVGAEAVDGLGRKGDEAAGGEHARRVGDRRGVGLRNACRQRGCH